MLWFVLKANISIVRVQSRAKKLSEKPDSKGFDPGKCVIVLASVAFPELEGILRKPLGSYGAVEPIRIEVVDGRMVKPVMGGGTSDVASRAHLLPAISHFAADVLN
jgi:hypothetical protein